MHRRKASNSSSVSSSTSNLYPIVQDLTPVEYGQGGCYSEGGDCCFDVKNICNNFNLRDLAVASVNTGKFPSTATCTAVVTPRSCTDSAQESHVPKKKHHRRSSSFFKRRDASALKQSTLDSTETSTVVSMDDSSTPSLIARHQTERFEDQYVLTRRVSRSNRAAVWECVHRESGVRYCCKILESYTSEVDLLQAAQGHGIVCCHRVFCDGTQQQQQTHHHRSNSSGKVHIVMDLITGGNLLSRVVQHDGHHLDQVTVKLLGQHLFQALAGLHANGILHNNIAPSNILLDASTSVPRLCDFGCASNTLELIQQQSQRRGSPYTAPEVASGQSPPTEASDLYSVAAVLYFCLFGQAPDEQPSFSTSSARHQPVSRRCKQLLSSCLYPDPSIRPTAAEACEHAWLELGRQPSMSSQEPLYQQSQSPTRKLRGVGRFFKGRQSSITRALSSEEVVEVSCHKSKV